MPIQSNKRCRGQALKNLIFKLIKYFHLIINFNDLGWNIIIMRALFNKPISTLVLLQSFLYLIHLLHLHTIYTLEISFKNERIEQNKTPAKAEITTSKWWNW